MFDGLNRKSGRTVRLVQMVEPGDVIICLTQSDKDHTQHLLHDAGKKHVNVAVLDIRSAWSVESHHRVMSLKGRVFFSHSWVKRFVEQRLKDTEKELETLERELSKMPHVERPTMNEQIVGMARNAGIEI
jgi:hypothetical protein